MPPERKRRGRDSWKPRTSWLGRSRKSCGRSGVTTDDYSEGLILFNGSVLDFSAVMTRTQWSRLVALKKMLVVARNSSRRLLPHPQLLPRPLTPHRPHPRIRPYPLPPPLHRVLQTSRGRWRAAVSRRGAGGRRWAHAQWKRNKTKRLVHLCVFLTFHVLVSDRHHWHQLPEWPDGHLWGESVLRRTYRRSDLHPHIETAAQLQLLLTRLNIRLCGKRPVSVVQTAGLCYVKEEM